MTSLTPPLDFDQSCHTQPSPRHHGSIYIDRFGYDAANSGEMNHHRRAGAVLRTSSFILWRCIGGGFYLSAIRRRLVVNPREMFWRLLCGRIPFCVAAASCGLKSSIDYNYTTINNFHNLDDDSLAKARQYWDNDDK
jgi:hypothetical protein